MSNFFGEEINYLCWESCPEWLVPGSDFGRCLSCLSCLSARSWFCTCLILEKHGRKSFSAFRKE
ncbi:hypothetical protein M407DRAFT_98339 [Tulasnella calospora MUT 4182]|uniref:Uncharacterized protein n=1 Tax=Tulasnella calospora MUT 4182 TaxID=1051891 RepID=A0A0C3L125_9AGAM|nr:hypothetical protein M407DRAFT_98339 [Tulasnella calospora MUT 4182]